MKDFIYITCPILIINEDFFKIMVEFTLLCNSFILNLCNQEFHHKSLKQMELHISYLNP